MRNLKEMSKKELIKEVRVLKAQLEERDPVSDLPPTEHNTFMELIYQMSAYKHEIRETIKANIDREQSIENFLNVFAHRYPDVRDYINGHKEEMDNLRLNYNGFMHYPLTGRNKELYTQREVI